MVIYGYTNRTRKMPKDRNRRRSLKIRQGRIYDVNKVLAVSICGSAAVTALAAIMLVNIPEYGLEIDAIKVEDLVAISNVRITNTGRMPLTELLIDMGQGDIQRLERLEPGKTVWISPKAQKLVSVTVTTKEGLVATKDFREPISMVEVGPG
ncbi:MAG: hypothetical protein QW177_06360 [Candidatus Nitrosotenuis sp.]